MVFYIIGAVLLVALGAYVALCAGINRSWVLAVLAVVITGCGVLAGVEGPVDVLTKRYRVGPAIAPYNMDREFSTKDLLVVIIVVADRCHSGEQILQSAPPEP